MLFSLVGLKWNLSPRDVTFFFFFFFFFIIFFSGHLNQMEVCDLRRA